MASREKLDKTEAEKWQGNGSGSAAGATAAHEDDGPPPVTGRKLAVIMISVLLGILLAALDQTIVGPAMPRIIADLNGFEQYSWVVTMYLLTSTITVPIFGKLSDMYGRKWFFIAGIVVFLIGSALSGFSQDMLQLIVFRGVQGLGAGILTANAFAIIADLIPPRDRGKWQGAFGAVFGLASVVGPFVGGTLTDGPGWRWVFFVNVPVGLVTLAVLLATFPHDSRHGVRKSIDWLGAATLTAGLTPLLIALSLGGTPGWDWGSTRVIAMLVGAALMLAVFVFVESRAKEPIIPLDLFKNSIFTVSVITMFMTGVGLFGAILFIPLFIQAIQGDSATNSGNAITPMTLAVVFSSIVTGQIMSRTGKYRVVGIVGMGLLTLGMGLLATMTADTDRLVTVTYMIIMGLGLGVAFPLYTLVVQNAFPIQRAGVVTAGVQFFRQIGATVGVAVLGGVVNTQFRDRFPAELQAQVNTLPAEVAVRIPTDRFSEGLSQLNPQVLVGAEGMQRLNEQLVNNFGVQPEFAGALVNLITAAMKPALFSGIREAFVIAAVLAGIGFVTTLFLKEIELRKTNRRGSMAEGGVMPLEEAAEKAGKELTSVGIPGPSTRSPRLGDS